MWGRKQIYRRISEKVEAKNRTFSQRDSEPPRSPCDKSLILDISFVRSIRPKLAIHSSWQEYKLANEGHKCCDKMLGFVKKEA